MQLYISLTVTKWSPTYLWVCTYLFLLQQISLALVWITYFKVRVDLSRTPNIDPYHMERYGCRIDLFHTPKVDPSVSKDTDMYISLLKRSFHK